MARRQKSDVERWQSNLAAERDAQALYLALARAEKDSGRAGLFRQLAGVEERHARRWVDKLRDAGVAVDEGWKPSWRPRALGLLARVTGPKSVLPIVTALEKGDRDMYVGQADAHDLVKEEEHLERVVAAIAEGRPTESIRADPLEPAAAPAPSSPRPVTSRSDDAESWSDERDHELRRARHQLAELRVTSAPVGAAPAAAGATHPTGAAPPPSLDREIAQHETWHRSAGAGSGTLRAAVFGVNDGLVSNLSLVMGVAGADPGNQFVLLAGVAGLLAGSFSMAAGEYVSMQSQRELFERQIALEREELEEDPAEEEHELSLIYQTKGVPRAEAERLAHVLMQDKQVALDTLAREELGLDPAELGSPWGAATSSFLAFGAGAILPVLPYLFLGGFAAFVASAVLSAVALFAVGGGVSLLTGRGVLFSGARMVLIGAAASGVTYMVGRLIGVSIAG